MFTTYEKMLDNVAATTTSDPVCLSDRAKVSIHVIEHTAGSGVFTVEVSNDQVNWIPYNRIVSNLTNTNAQTDTKVASVTLAAPGSQMLFFPTGDHMAYIRIIVTVTGGTYSAILSAK